MYNKDMHELGSRRSVIRDLFEYGKQRAARLGADKVFDYSLGNPSVPAPKEINESIIRLLERKSASEIHGYTSAQGNASVRNAISKSISKRHGFDIPADNIYMTAGAAAALAISINALKEEGDEFIAFAPYFPEYKVFVEATGAKFKSVPFDPDNFMPDLEAFEKAISENTKGVIVNSPNNPCGCVYGRKTLESIAAILEKANSRYDKAIALLADEPYREITYGNVEVPYIPRIYDHTIVCYSFSKSLSLPGERIGYVAVSPRMKHAGDIACAVAGAGRALGYVCAPSLFQQVIEECLDAKSDLASYARNRDFIYKSLTRIGYECVEPNGAFYIFVKSLEPDDKAFSEKAKEYGLLLVPGEGFAAPGYVRLAYCVSFEMMQRSMPAFEKLYKDYQGK